MLETYWLQSKYYMLYVFIVKMYGLFQVIKIEKKSSIIFYNLMLPHCNKKDIVLLSACVFGILFVCCNVQRTRRVCHMCDTTIFMCWRNACNMIFFGLEV